MRIHAALGAALLIAVTAAAPVAALAPEGSTARPAAGTTMTVRADCLGAGTIVVKQHGLASGATRVVVTGQGVPDGRWKGAFAPDASDVGRDVDLTLDAVDHEFRTAFQVEDVTGDTNTTLLRGRPDRVCSVGATVTKRSTSVSGATIGLAGRVSAADRLTVRGAVVGCENRSSWGFEVSARSGDSATGGAGEGAICRRHQVRVPTLTGTGVEGPVTALDLVARSHGEVHRIGYRLSGSE